MCICVINSNVVCTYRSEAIKPDGRRGRRKINTERVNTNGRVGGRRAGESAGVGHINYKSKWNLLAEFESIGCDDDDGGGRVFLMHFACGCARINGDAKVENPCFLYNGKASGPSSARARAPLPDLSMPPPKYSCWCTSRRASARFVLEDF